jgi:transcriptional regulator with XRE-family HTH domain
MESDFKKNLRAELYYLDLTVKELSAKAGVAKGTLDCYLGARASMPPADIAVKIADALGVSVEYLVTGKEANNGAAVPTFNHTIRSIMQTALELNEKDRETMLGLGRVLKTQAEKTDTPRQE